MLDRSEPAGLTFHVQTTMRADICKPRVVEIVQSQFVPGDTQLGDKVNAADARTDDRYGFAHAITPVCRSAPSVSRS